MSAPETSGPDRGLGEGLRRAADAATPRPIDVERVLAASRGRRRSRRSAVLGVAATAAVLLAAGGLATAVNVLGPRSASDSALTSESAADTAPEAGSEPATEASGAGLAAPEKVNLCGAPVAAATDASGSGLVVTVEPPAALAPGATGDARVTVTNAGSTPVAGELRVVPALTVAGDGVTRWHTNGAVAATLTPVTLEPGASATLDGPVTAVACGSDDELAAAFPPTLPPLVPGDYAVTAVVVFIDHETGAIEYLVSPLAPLHVL